MSKNSRCTHSEVEAKYRKVLKRIVWREQYHSKKLLKKESVVSEFFVYSSQNEQISDCVISGLYVSELISKVPSKKGRYILKKIYVEGLEEKDVAQSLKISQQAVNKWKKKSIDTIRKTIT